MALTDTGEVLSFGKGEDGQLGHGEEVNQLVPRVIEALSGTRVVAIAAGGGHSMVLTGEGTVLSFGDGVSGRLGHGDEEDQLVPKVIAGLQANNRLFAGSKDSAAQADAKRAAMLSDAEKISLRDFLSKYGEDGLAGSLPRSA